MKLNKSMLGIVLTIIMIFSMTVPAFAAVPAPVAIVGGRAYSFDYIRTNADAMMNIASGVDAGTIIVKANDDLIMNPVTGAIVNSSALPALEYYAPDGTKTNYKAGDGEVDGEEPPVGDLEVVGISAINANTISVTFEGIEEPVEIELEEALVHGENEVTFEYEGQTFTVTVNYEDPEVVEEEKAEAIKNAIDKINAIGKPATLTLEDEAKVVAARTAVNAAKELGAVDADIVNLDHLNAAETQINALKEALNEKETAIQEANVALTNLPLEVTLEDKEQVEEARELVNKALELGAEENDFVNLWKLTDAEAKIAELEEEAAEAEAVQAVIDAIDALPEEITLEDAEAVADARAAYDALTEEQQELVTNVDVLEAAEAKIAELEEEAAKELKVESVSAIEATIVEVTFDALTEALTDVTIEVKDGEGNVYEVVAQDLAKGATSAQFDFVKPVAATNLTGVWTVNGVDYSFDELELVQDIVAASAAPVNEVNLLGLLNEAGIQNIDENRISAYAAEIVAEQPVLFKDVQKNIDDVNKAAAETADEAAVVKAVVDATNQIQLLAALEANFERVNADWIAEYAVEAVGTTTKGMLELDETNSTGVTADDIQAAIDQVNNDVIFTATTGLNDKAATSTEQAEVTALIQAWIVPDDPATPLLTPKADAIQASKEKEAAFRVAEATTENSIYNALVAYANITPDATLKASELNVNLKAEYKTALENLTKATLVDTIQTGKHADATDGIKTKIVTAADTAALTTAMGNVATKFAAVNLAPTDATALAEFKASLQKVADVTSHKTGTDKFDMSKVVDASLADYATECATATAITSASTVADLQGKITTVNDAAAINAALDIVNDADATLAEVREALIDIVIEQGAGTGTTDVDFLNLSKQAQLEVAELVVDARPALGYANLDAIILPADGTGALKTAMDAHDAELAKFNTIGDLAAATVTSTKTALDTYAYEPYVALTNAQKLAVAEEINKLVHVNATTGVETPYDFTTGTGDDAVKTLAEANAYIDAAIAAIK